MEPKDRIYVKGFEFLSFAKKMSKSLSSKYGQKPLDNAKKLTTDAIKTPSKTAIQKTAEKTGDLIGYKIADKVTSVSKKSSTRSQHNEGIDELETPKERCISPEKRQQIIDKLNNVIMEYEKIINMLDNASNQPSKFRTKNLVETNDDPGGTYHANKQIKFKTKMLKSVYVITVMHIKEQ